MKILQVSSYAPPMTGGSETFCFGLSRRLHKLGHDVTVWTSRLPKNSLKVDYKEGFPVKRFFCASRVLEVNPAFLILPDLFRAMAEFDIVHSHSYIYFCSNQLAICRTVRSFPYILHLHGGLGKLNSFSGTFRPVLKEAYDRTLGKFTMKMADRIISVSSADADVAVERFSVDANKIVVIPNAVDTGRFQRTRVENRGFATYIGRLVAWKGCAQMPYIFNTLAANGVDTRVVGDGPYFSFLRRRCPSTEFTGYLPPSKIPDVLRDTSVLVLPSFLEGLPTVCLEAMSAGVPSVAYDVGGVAEVVRNGVTGYTVEVGNSAALVRACCVLFKNHERYREMSERCFHIARSKYDWSSVTKRIVCEYEKVIAKRTQDH